MLYIRPKSGDALERRVCDAEEKGPNISIYEYIRYSLREQVRVKLVLRVYYGRWGNILVCNDDYDFCSSLLVFTSVSRYYLCASNAQVPTSYGSCSAPPAENLDSPHIPQLLHDERWRDPNCSTTYIHTPHMTTASYSHPIIYIYQSHLHIKIIVQCHELFLLQPQLYTNNNIYITLDHHEYCIRMYDCRIAQLL